MSILNYMQTGTYSTVEDVVYRRLDSSVSFTLAVWKDSTKKVRLVSIPFRLDNSVEAFAVSGTDPGPAPDTAIDIEALITAEVTKIIEGTTSYKDHIFVERNSLKPNVAETDWGTLNPYDDLYIYRSDLLKHYKYESDAKAFIEQDADLFTSDKFDTYFALSVQSQDTYNLSKCIYEYLLTRDDFSGTTSG